MQTSTSATCATVAARICAPTLPDRFTAPAVPASKSITGEFYGRYFPEY